MLLRLAVAALVALLLAVCPGSQHEFDFRVPPCPARPTSAFPWPVKPFDRQHPIRGAFGDPRTLSPDQPFGQTGPTASGHYQLHYGIDIVAPGGTAVYPVADGQVVGIDSHRIAVFGACGREFDYTHLIANVSVAQVVVAGRTILGWTHRPLDHVHLSELDDGHYRNPLARGHLEPYADHTTPRVVALDIGRGGLAHLTQGGVVGTDDELAIDAVDAPAMRIRGAFSGMPQTPAFVQWRLEHGRHRGPWHVAADFRSALPTVPFWSIYAAGTYQNFANFDHKLQWRVPGVYLFRVGLDPSTLSPGAYEIEARVSDIRGNTATRTWPIEIRG
jgi:hypothetical protein